MSARRGRRRRPAPAQNPILNALGIRMPAAPRREEPSADDLDTRSSTQRRADYQRAQQRAQAERLRRDEEERESERQARRDAEVQAQRERSVAGRAARAAAAAQQQRDAAQAAQGQAARAARAAQQQRDAAQAAQAAAEQQTEDARDDATRALESQRSRLESQAQQAVLRAKRDAQEKAREDKRLANLALANQQERLTRTHQDEIDKLLRDAKNKLDECESRIREANALINSEKLNTTQAEQQGQDALRVQENKTARAVKAAEAARGQAEQAMERLRKINEEYTGEQQANVDCERKLTDLTKELRLCNNKMFELRREVTDVNRDCALDKKDLNLTINRLKVLLNRSKAETKKAQDDLEQAEDSSRHCQQLFKEHEMGRQGALDDLKIKMNAQEKKIKLMKTQNMRLSTRVQECTKELTAAKATIDGKQVQIDGCETLLARTNKEKEDVIKTFKEFRKRVVPATGVVAASSGSAADARDSKRATSNPSSPLALTKFRVKKVLFWWMFDSTIDFKYAADIVSDMKRGYTFMKTLDPNIRDSGVTGKNMLQLQKSIKLYKTQVRGFVKIAIDSGVGFEKGAQQIRRLGVNSRNVGNDTAIRNMLRYIDDKSTGARTLEQDIRNLKPLLPASPASAGSFFHASELELRF
jgi:hypothetical protein